MKILLDMDGVIADFVGAACSVHMRYGTFTDPANRGIFDIEKIWGISPGAFWDPINRLGEKFWLGLDKTPEADEIVKLAKDSVGVENIAILTAPSQEASCFIGKRKWLNRWYPEFGKRIIFGSAKEFLASPERILIDDRDKNIEAFNAAGGHGILVPRLWNSRHSDKNRVMEILEEEMKKING